MDGKMNIKQILQKFLSRWYYFVIALLITTLTAYVYLKFTPRQYFVKASLLLRTEPKPEIGSDSFLKGLFQTANQPGIEDEIGILKSYSMVERTIRELDFGVAYFRTKSFVTEEQYRDSPFTIEIDSVVGQIIDEPIFIQRVTSTRYKVHVSGQDLSVYNFYTNQVDSKVDKIEIDEEVPVDRPFKSQYLAFNIKFSEVYKTDPKAKYFFKLNRIQSLTETYQRKLRIKPISSESSIVELGLTGLVAAKEKVFLDKLLDVYLRNELYKKNQLGLKTIRFIDSQLAGVPDTSSQAGGPLALYRSKDNILDVNTAAENLNRSLAKAEANKAALESNLKYYRFTVNSVQNNNNFAEIVTPAAIGIDDPELNNLLIELSKLNQERKGLIINPNENNALAEIVDQKIRNAKGSLIKNINNSIDASTVALNDLNRRILQIRKNLSVLPKNDRELVSIQGRFDFNDNVYNYLLEKRAEAGIAIASNSLEKTVVDKPYQVGDGPASPNSRLIFLLAIFGGIAIAIGMIVVRDILNENIITQEDLEAYTKIPFIGTISHANKREQATIVAHARSAVGESFRSLRVNLQYLTLGQNANVIGITSSRESEGKTFCAVNLAAVMAYSGRRTILIDTDMRRPRVATYFQLEGRKGLSNFLVDDGTVKEIINNTEHKGFDVICSGPIPPNPIDLIGSPRMEELITTLKQTYSTIILDSPPVGYVSEYIILMKYTDANLYIVRSDYTNRNSLGKINKLHERKKISNVSILLNDVKATKSSGYGYGYEYSYKY
ncbi:MAG: polysaccharide biosynthesis tyrosine autokinase [Cyclobacteriaceae bacterium]|nr:polysaccharide biosynthesis tyrosine autokinase [Cyclobacteriaceae bacterium]MDH4295079.1 polysaccharide biosynthesis tyrosine autokinase [Cyclobacteriaceae bacterium]MDH5248863.1 polysaccharide biosynthesis tyrosine autokinase [Cyclobacteriaceae bacterium]